MSVTIFSIGPIVEFILRWSIFYLSNLVPPEFITNKGLLMSRADLTNLYAENTSKLEPRTRIESDCSRCRNA